MADPKRVVLRDLARVDVEDAIDWYRDNVDVDSALDLVDAIAAGLEHLGHHPGAGSPRYSIELDLPGIRAWLLDRFPYIIFYVEHAEHVDVWRVLHAHRDIAAWLHDRESPSTGAGTAE